MIKEMSFGKWLGLLVAALFLALLMYGCASMVDLASHGWVYSGACLLLSAAMVALYARFVLWFEGEKPKDLPLNKLASHTGLGLGIGLGYFCAVTGLMALMGGYAIVGWGASAKELVSMFCYFSIVAVGEEILFRGVLFRWIDEKWGFWVAISVSALLFGLLHITNPGGTLWSSIAIAIEGEVANVTSGAFARKYHLPSASSVNSAVKGLLVKDFITLGKNGYHAYDKLFALWVKRYMII